MNEASKIRERLKREGSFEQWFKGRILDIGCGNDKILPEADGWDRPQGDSQKLEGLADESYDTVFSSHNLEHMRDPLEALLNWWRVLKPGGYLIVDLPEEDLYEQGIWPSVFNPDHKFTFSISKTNSWSPNHKNLLDLVKFLPNHKIIHLRTIDTNYDYSKLGAEKVVDQTLGDAEAALELVAQKAPSQLKFRTPLAATLICQLCQSMSLVCRGKTSKGLIAFRCQQCGADAEVKM